MASLSACCRTWTATSPIPCGWTGALRSCPTTRGTATSIPCCPTEKTCSATRTMRTSMSATPARTESGWSSSPRVSCGCYPGSGPTPCGWTSPWGRLRSRGGRPCYIAKHLGEAVPDAAVRPARWKPTAPSPGSGTKTAHRASSKQHPGVRARLPRPLNDGRLAYIADRDGVEALVHQGRRRRPSPTAADPPQPRPPTSGRAGPAAGP